jgi:NAD(P)-dependent dehydrogenase (short-subunit alcohol dehydrogenase family)
MNTITGKTILITGASRGIGRALLEEALRRGAQQVYAGTRAPFAHPDERVTPLLLDVTDAAQTQQAAQTVSSLDVLVNNVSTAAFAPLPLIPAYSISKAAVFCLTQAQQALLADRSVRVHAVLTGPTDTDMSRGFDVPKASPESVARAIFDGVENEEEDIFPDPMSQTMAASWHSSPGKALEREYAAIAAAERAKSHV